MKTDYTIFEYNAKTKEYTVLGHQTAETSVEARTLFAKKSKYKRREGYTLFAQIPICR